MAANRHRPYNPGAVSRVFITVRTNPAFGYNSSHRGYT
jgi:hypothetical protein